MRGQNSDFRGTIIGIWGNRTIILGGPINWNLTGPNSDFGGTMTGREDRKMLRNWSGQNNDFWGTNDFRGTINGIRGDRTMILGGSKECLSLPNFNFLVNLGLQKYSKKLLVPPNPVVVPLPL